MASFLLIGGAAFLLMIMQYVGLSSVRVSESDNMLGYLRKKVFGEGYEKRERFCNYIPDGYGCT